MKFMLKKKNAKLNLLANKKDTNLYSGSTLI